MGMVVAANSSKRWWMTPLFRGGVAIISGIVLALVVFQFFGVSLLERIGMPHEFCYLRDPKLVWLHVISDALIGVSYVAISVTLACLVFRTSRDIPFNWILLAFGLFIVSCGFTHFMEVWVIWEPVYWLSGYVKVITAAASLTTAIALLAIFTKIIAAVTAARASEARRVEIERLNHELERFNYSVAHDLRGPLRGVSGYAQLLKKHLANAADAQANEYLERLQGSVKRMDNMVTELLRFALVSGQELRCTPVSLQATLAHVVELLAPDIRQRRATVTLSPNLPVVLGEPALLQVVFQNLLSNALKFVGPDVVPRVSVTSEVSGGVAIIAVTDNGIGVPERYRSRLFGMFERFHPDYSGTGIGLALVSRAVQRLKGEIQLDETFPGSGSRFLIRLPVANPADPETVRRRPPQP